MDIEKMKQDVIDSVEEKKKTLDERLKIILEKLELYKDVPIVKALLGMNRRARSYTFDYLCGGMGSSMKDTINSIGTIIWLYENCLKEDGKLKDDLVYAIMRGSSYYKIYLKSEDGLPEDVFCHHINSEDEMMNIIEKNNETAGRYEDEN